jgi:hypothetical protein
MPPKQPRRRPTTNGASMSQPRTSVLAGIAALVAVIAAVWVVRPWAASSSGPSTTGGPDQPLSLHTLDIVKCRQAITCDAGAVLLMPSGALESSVAAVARWLRGGKVDDEQSPLDVILAATPVCSRHLERHREHMVNAITDGLRRVGARDDGYCDCADGADEPATGACDRALRRRSLGQPPVNSRRCRVFGGVQDLPLHGSRIGDGISDCCDGSDEETTSRPSAPNGTTPPPQQCLDQARRSRAVITRWLAAAKNGTTQCAQRARIGREEFFAPFNATVADRHVVLAEAAQLAQHQSQLAQTPLSPGEDAAGRMPVAQLQQLVSWLQQEQPLQGALEQAVAAVKEFPQLYLFAPRVSGFGRDSLRKGISEEEATQRLAMHQLAARHVPTCLNATRDETEFRGGTAVPDSYNFTFTVCPLDVMVMTRLPPWPRDGNAESTSTNTATTDATASTTGDGHGGGGDATKQEEATTTSVLGRFIYYGLAADLSSFHAFLAMSAGGPGPYSTEAEDPRMFNVMQSLWRRRTNEGGDTKKKRSKPSPPPTDPSPLHPFDFEPVASASVQRVAWFSHGDSCWGGPHRHARLLLVCGDDDRLLDVRENGKCAYEAIVETPSMCCSGDGSVHPDVAARTKRLEKVISRLERILANS